jgi:MauM/NapG family ferredoxin protein
LIFSSIFISGYRVNKKNAAINHDVIRPPAALNEEEFLNRCVRCGNCMKVCITNGLQPTMFQSGLQGVWTPRLVPEIGYCEYQCTLCGNTCPTGAILSLSVEQKKAVKLGVAEIDRSICIPWAHNKDCIVCEEHCPISQKAIKLKGVKIGSRTIFRPYIDEVLCVGCGICQNKCPVRPRRAIEVAPRNADRPMGGLKIL